MKMRGNENLIDHFFNFCICWPVVRLPVGVQQETHLWIQTVKVLVVFNTFNAILFHRSHFAQWNPKGLKLFSCIPPVLSIAESTNYKWWWEWKGRMQYVTNLEHSSFLLYNQGRDESQQSQHWADDQSPNIRALNRFFCICLSEYILTCTNGTLCRRLSWLGPELLELG